MDESTIQAEAVKIANLIKNHGITVPRYVIDPGLYIGFILGVKFIEQLSKESLPKLR